jgi:hypothetical protein
MVSARVARERRVAEDVPECAEVGRVVVSLLEKKKAIIDRLFCESWSVTDRLLLDCGLYIYSPRERALHGFIDL